MYVRKGRKLTVEEVFNSLKNQTDNVSDNVLLAYANQIVQVNNNLLEEKGVYGVLKKNPVSPNKGYHYFSIVYTQDNDIRRLYTPKIAKLIGAHIDEKRYSIPFFAFRSNAKDIEDTDIDRLFDATDRFFKFLESLGGCYAQISLL